MPPKANPFVPSEPPIAVEECKKKFLKALKQCPKTRAPYLVIGCGFLGSRIIECLLHRKENVTVFDFDKDSKWAKDPRVKFICGDITNLDTLLSACKNMDTVYLTAAAINFMDKIPYQYQRSFAINVTGTENVIKACQERGVKHLIQTSTVHVTVPCDKHGIIYTGEEDPYVTEDNCTSYYGLTKAMAESLVLAANSSSLRTVAVRPPGIYGGYDHLVVEPMLRDKEYVYIGASIFIDWVYVDNIAFAHLLAEKELREGNAKVGGQAFNVTDNNPVWNVDFRERVIHYSGKKVQRKYAPYNLILMMGYAIHAGQSMLQHRFPRLQEPLSYLTLTALRIMNIDMVVRSKKAKSVLGYEPPFDLDEGIQLSIAEYEGGFNNSNMLLK